MEDELKGAKEQIAPREVEKNNCALTKEKKKANTVSQMGPLNEKKQAKKKLLQTEATHTHT